MDGFATWRLVGMGGECAVYLRQTPSTLANMASRIWLAKCMKIKIFYKQYFAMGWILIKLSQSSTLLGRVRETIRCKYYSIKTEHDYVDWVRRFVAFRGRRHPRDMGAEEASCREVEGGGFDGLGGLVSAAVSLSRGVGRRLAKVDRSGALQELEAHAGHAFLGVTHREQSSTLARLMG